MITEEIQWGFYRHVSLDSLISWYAMYMPQAKCVSLISVVNIYVHICTYIKIYIIFSLCYILLFLSRSSRVYFFFICTYVQYYVDIFVLDTAWAATHATHSMHIFKQTKIIIWEFLVEQIGRWGRPQLWKNLREQHTRSTNIMYILDHYTLNIYFFYYFLIYIHPTFDYDKEEDKLSRIELNFYDWSILHKLFLKTSFECPILFPATEHVIMT